MGKHVHEVMMARPQAVTRDTTLSQAAQLMETEDVGALPVVEDSFLVGMVTDRDIVVRAVAHDLDPRTTPVSQIASKEVVKLNPGHDLDDALKLMARHKVRRIAVTDADNRLVGVVSQADVAREGKEKDIGQVVEAISEPAKGPRVTGPTSGPDSTSQQGPVTEEDRLGSRDRPPTRG